MRRHALSFIACMALAGSGGAGADSPALDAAALGHMEGVLAVCSRVSPQAANGYLVLIKAAIGQATRQDVLAARSDEAYRGEYEAVAQSVGNLSPEGLTEACGAYLTNAR